MPVFSRLWDASDFHHHLSQEASANSSAAMAKQNVALDASVNGL
jgi:hypothetical protein